MEHTSRQLINEFDNEFRKLHNERNELILKVGDDMLFRETDNSRTSMMPHSVGTFAIRSAAAVEQMINGITVRLWDDPFEWTLPEQLPTVQDLIGYFDEVESARIRGFEFLNDDADLQKLTPAPVELKSLAEVLAVTLNRSKEFLLSAESTLPNAV